MPCGAIVYFDGETDAAVRKLWQALEDAGLPLTMPGLNTPPHLTLTACEDMDFPELREKLAGFVANHPPMPVRFNGLGIFMGRIPVVYLAVTPGQALMELHAHFEEIARPYLHGQNEYYLPDIWVPHVTLAREFPVAMTGAITDALLRQPLPAIGLLRDLALVDFVSEQNGLREMFVTRLGSYL